MAKKPATPGTAFVGPLYIVDKDGEVLGQWDGAPLLASNVVTNVTAVVDASAGGSAQTTAIATVPAGSTLLNVKAVLDVPFDSSGTKTCEVGVSGNADAYIDTSDFSASGSAGLTRGSAGGANNDVKGAQFAAADIPIIATWTNQATATAGQVTVTVSYIAPVA